MQTIYYGQSEFDTADAIASALLDYAEGLSSHGRYAVVDIPTVTPFGVANARLLIGAGIPLASATRAAEIGMGEGIARDEFGGGGAGSGAGMIGDLDVHRTVKGLADGLRRTMDSHPTAALDGERRIDDVAERGGH